MKRHRQERDGPIGSVFGGKHSPKLIGKMPKNERLLVLEARIGVERCPQTLPRRIKSKVIWQQLRRNFAKKQPSEYRKKTGQAETNVYQGQLRVPTSADESVLLMAS